MSDEYKEKFSTFLNAFGMKDVEDFIELPIEDIRITAIIIKLLTNNSKTHELLEDLHKVNDLFASTPK